MLDINKTILPMNTGDKQWKNLGFTREELKKPENNIRAGAMLLKALSSRVPKDDPYWLEKLSTLYNGLNSTGTTDYGARFADIYRNRLWEDKKR
ncbi:MAG: hypothetical protein HQL53_14745 [Magnetococcales bacterium]|nr:hypothetical protein [Magnetococcales bacterium]